MPKGSKRRNKFSESLRTIFKMKVVPDKKKKRSKNKCRKDNNETLQKRLDE